MPKYRTIWVDSARPHARAALGSGAEVFHTLTEAQLSLWNEVAKEHRSPSKLTNKILSSECALAAVGQHFVVGNWDHWIEEVPDHD